MSLCKRHTSEEREKEGKATFFDSDNRSILFLERSLQRP